LERSLRHSLNFGVYHDERQIGFGRIITDFATFAYVADVFILPEYRGRKLSAWLMQVMTQHPDLQGLRRWLLVTRDAGGLYRKSGFEPLSRPEHYMQRPGV
jgi:GNAT superfamily N-acetyltransferase